MTLRVNTVGTTGGWSLEIKIKRVLWAPFGVFFLRGTTRYLSPLRIVLLKLFGARIARHTLVMDGVKVWYPWNLEMHRGAALGVGVEVYNFAPVLIGEQATVSQYSYLCTASHDYSVTTMPLIYRPITICDQAWVAAGSFIGPGVTVHQGAVVAARAVVTKDVAAWMVVGGNPAREIKRRTLIA
jgi:putative colanic acid biosynthesis acetyltransferase WcaF